MTIRLSSFHLVQICAWERFIGLRPKPNLIKWGAKITSGVENVRTVLDSAGQSFYWRPQIKTMKNWNLPNFCGKKEMSVTIDADSSDEFQSFARCLSTSKLVGLDCIEQDLPHQVEMQFGMDQGLPACVARANENRHIYCME